MISVFVQKYLAYPSHDDHFLENRENSLLNHLICESQETQSATVPRPSSSVLQGGVSGCVWDPEIP